MVWKPPSSARATPIQPSSAKSTRRCVTASSRPRFKFDGEQPDNIRSGQTYYLNLQLGQPEEAIIIPRGTFYQKTGGKWIYVVNKDGNKAVKREIRIGRQNPQYYEVLEGLEPGERVITSGYDTYGDSDVLVF